MRYTREQHKEALLMLVDKGEDIEAYLYYDDCCKNEIDDSFEDAVFVWIANYVFDMNTIDKEIHIISSSNESYEYEYMLRDIITNRDISYSSLFE